MSTYTDQFLYPPETDYVLKLRDCPDCTTTYNRFEPCKVHPRIKGWCIDCRMLERPDCCIRAIGITIIVECGNCGLTLRRSTFVSNTISSSS